MTGPGPQWFGFVNDWALVNRLRARYRLARDCRGLSTSTYSANVRDGYSALTRAFLAWSAFEMLMRVRGLHSDAQIAAALTTAGAGALLEEFQRHADCLRFFGGIRENSDRPKQVAALDDFLAGRAPDPGRVLGSVRHIFAHGFLTPSVGGTEPTSTSYFCNTLADFLLQTVDSIWEGAVLEGEAEWRKV